MEGSNNRPSYKIEVSFDQNNLFENMFTSMEKERRERIKKLEKLRERRFVDCKSVRKIGAKGDFSYLDEYGRRMEEDMALFKELTRQREEQESNWVERPLSPLPPLFDISPVHSPKPTYRVIGNEDYRASRMATMIERGLTGVMQEFYGQDTNPYSVSGPEGAAIASQRLSQINERIAKLKMRATEIQEGIQSHMGGLQDSSEADGATGISTTTSSDEALASALQQEELQKTQNFGRAPEIKITTPEENQESEQQQEQEHKSNE